MKIVEFIDRYYPHALQCEKVTGINKNFILAQAAIESGWGRYIKGNALFGIKDTDGLNGNEQLFLTTEYHSHPNVPYPKVVSVTKIGKMWKYRVYDYFRKYDSVSDCFVDHCSFFIKNKRYKTALEFKSDPRRFAEEIAKAGYATDPVYSKTLKAVIDMIEPITKLIR